MKSPQEIRPGQRLSANTLREIASQARNATNLTGSGVNVSSTPAGMTVALSRPRIAANAAIRCRAWNNSGVSIPPYSPVTVLGLMQDNPQTEAVLSVELLSNEYAGHVVIADNGIQPNAVGHVVVNGLSLVRVYRTDAGALGLKASVGETFPTNRLLVGEDGDFDVFWESSFTSTEDHVALIRMGGGSGRGNADIWTASNYTELQEWVSTKNIDAPALGYVLDYNYYYKLEGSVFRICGKFIQNTAPVNQGHRHGDLWLDTSLSPKQLKWFGDSGMYGSDWHKLSHYTVTE